MKKSDLIFLIAICVIVVGAFVLFIVFQTIIEWAVLIEQIMDPILFATLAGISLAVMSIQNFINTDSDNKREIIRNELIANNERINEIDKVNKDLKSLVSTKK